MRTVATLCASGAGIGVSAIGLSLVTNDHNFTTHQRFPQANTPSDHDMSLTTTAVFTFSASNSSPAYKFSTPEPLNRPQFTSHPNSARSVSENASGIHLRNRGRETRASLAGKRSTSVTLGDGDHQITRQNWLRRFSTSMSSSRDSSRTPQSRPASAAVSHSNASVGVSLADSADPILSTPIQQSAPNKLVKRSSSIRSTRDISTSKLPVPTLKRPATSHQRSSMLQGQYIDTDRVGHTSDGNVHEPARDQQWQSYFIAKTARNDAWNDRRRSSGIPNPIKRIYPDRRYRPALVSGKEDVTRAEIEFDDSSSNEESDVAIDLDQAVASSPMLMTSTNFGQEQAAKRSFSIGDLLATGPRTSQRPSTSSSNGRSRLLRRYRRPNTSSSQTDMGGVLSFEDVETQRANKKRIISPASIFADSHSIKPEHTASSPTPQASRPPSLLRRKSSDVALNPSRSSSIDQRRTLSAPFSTIGQRSARASTNTSEFTSGGDSDSEYKSFGESNTDYQSDAVFDSIPSRITRSSSGRRGPPIDTIFDDTPPSFSSGRSTKLKDFLNQENFVPENAHRYSTIEEEESIATPVRSSVDKSITSSPIARSAKRNSILSSSPPTVREMPDPDDIDWDAEDDEEVDSASNRQTFDTPAQARSLPFRFAPAVRALQPTSMTSTPQRNGVQADRGSIFDWSEAQPSPSHNHSPPRPRTVHGKKDPENRGSRSTARRPPSGMHARSHSVPTAPDLEGKRSTTVANKFGTWGVGSKAVTEDWNEDFDFDDSLVSAESVATAEKRIDSGHEIFVPRAIREQQEHVVANIGLLREWGLLIEELKELRIRAVALNMLKGEYAHAWSEVDAMIELADQETEEKTLQPRTSPPSSPGFDFGAFEDPVGQNNDLAIQPAPLPEPLLPIKPPEIQTPTVASSPTRPRKDSEAIARSVIEGLRARRVISESTSLQPVTPARKVPFDTATLRHIVPYVNGLKRKVKDGLRETEGLYKSPNHRFSEAREQSGGALQLRGIFRTGSPVAGRRRETWHMDGESFGSDLEDDSFHD